MTKGMLDVLRVLDYYDGPQVFIAGIRELDVRFIGIAMPFGSPAPYAIFGVAEHDLQLFLWGETDLLSLVSNPTPQKYVFDGGASWGWATMPADARIEVEWQNGDAPGYTMPEPGYYLHSSSCKGIDIYAPRKGGQEAP